MVCPVCEKKRLAANERSRLWRERHPKRAKEQQKKSRAKNREKNKKKNNQYRKDNLEKIRKYQRDFARKKRKTKEGVIYFSGYNRNYKGKKRAVTSRKLDSFDKFLIKQFCDRVAELNLEVGKSFYQLDHIVPLEAGGLHAPENLQILTKVQHSIKTKRDKATMRVFHGL